VLREIPIRRPNLDTACLVDPRDGEAGDRPALEVVAVDEMPWS